MVDDAFHRAGQAFFASGALLSGTLAVGVLGTGFLVLVQSFAPNILARSAAAVRHHPVISPLAGLGIGGLLFLGIALGKKAPLLGAICLFDLVAFGLCGLVPFCEDLGRRIWWLRGREGSRVGHLVTGWPVFFTASCVPFLGWFLILPFGVLTGLGSLLVGAFTRPDAGAPRGEADLEMQ